MRKLFSTNMFLYLSIILTIPTMYVIKQGNILLGVILALFSVICLVFYYFFNKIEDFRRYIAYIKEDTEYDKSQDVQARRNTFKVLQGGKRG